MTITTTKLSRLAGLSAVAAGLAYILIQFIHPHEDVTSVASPAWAAVHVATMAMCVLALIGISGAYLRQVHQAGLLGLIGYGLFATCFLVIFGFTFVEAFVLPSLADQAPQFVDDVLAVPTGGDVVGDVGALRAVSGLSAVTYLFGGLLFGVALARAGVTARWAALLLAGGTVATIAVPVLPHAIGRMMALPVGVALVGLGCSLWGATRTAERPIIGAGDARLSPVGGAE
jgi:hypothetical protein